ncbi:MAG: AraC family transcriptional regulator [Bacillota bacterium]
MKKTWQNYQSRQYMLKNEYEVFHYKDLEFSEVELHHHDFYEVYLFLSGKATYMIEGRSYILSPGDIILVNTDELHQLQINNKSVAYERIVLWIKPQFLKELGSKDTDLSYCFRKSEASRTNLVRSAAVTGKVQRCLTNLLVEADYGGYGSDIYYKNLIQQIMIEINRGVLDVPSTDVEDVVTDNLIYSVLVFISENISRPLTLDDIASEFHVSKYHLLREFKRYVGTTVYRYILQKRLILAKQLILRNMPIKEVYLETGFGDYSNFFRAFKMEYGITPKEFLKLTRADWP